MKKMKKIIFGILGLTIVFTSCNNSKDGAINSNIAEESYIAPGELDEYYAFMSGGFSGQLAVHGLPSGRLFKVIPVFSQDPEKGYGYNEETKPMLNTSFGFIPWGDAHHPDLSQTNGEIDGRWCFINENNTPRIARIDLTTFETVEIIELPNSAGNHSSPYVTDNTEYVVAGTRFGVPVPQKDMPINEYKGNFKGALSFIKIHQETGEMDLEFQIIAPGFDYDKAHPGRKESHGWMFFTTYNVEESNTLLEVNASQRDKDFIAAVNWKKAEEYIKSGKFNNILVVGSEVQSTAMDLTDRGRDTAVIFADGAGAAILKPSNDPGIVHSKLGANGAYSNLLYVPYGTSKRPVKEERNDNFLQMKGNEVFKVAVKTLERIAMDSLKEANMT